MMKLKLTKAFRLGVFHSLNFVSQDAREVFLANTLPNPSPYRLLLTDQVSPVDILEVRDIRLPEDSPLHLGSVHTEVDNAVGYVIYSRWGIQNHLSALVITSYNWIQNSSVIPEGELPVIYRDKSIAVFYSPNRAALVVTGEISQELQDFLKL